MSLRSLTVNNLGYVRSIWRVFAIGCLNFLEPTFMSHSSSLIRIKGDAYLPYFTFRSPTCSLFNMSWMDSWSRPGKSQATPAPYYLLPGGESTPYCRSCGRVINSRRANAAAAHDSDNNTPSYCSQRCRNTKPRKLDREIEATFVRMLSEGDGCGNSASQPRQGKKAKKGATKGDPRIIVSCDEVEKAVFGDGADPDKTFGRKKNRASRSLPEVTVEEEDDNYDGGPGENTPADGDSAVALTDEDTSSIDGDVLARMAVRSGTRVRPPQNVSLVNGSVGGEKGRAERGEETEENARRRLEGQRRAQQREMVRSAARRGVVFGFAGAVAGDGAPRKCEAVMQGKVVEPSFAKGDWGVRWRE
ncbi:hypothetical protein F5Y05DRAFT_367721 [Hypoxylon sp. FL0543]|nr:hypothetical protein F5Y05DRAFT_367721 [Hypoxylon sp. FL0543]